MSRPWVEVGVWVQVRVREGVAVGDRGGGQEREKADGGRQKAGEAGVGLI